METAHVELPVAGVRAMAWIGGELVDVAGGWRTLWPDLQEARFSVYGPQFDAAVASPAGDLCALVSTVGTSALILGLDGRVVREVHRSYYHADAYRYPIALFTLPDGQTGLAHCPRRYDLLEVEVAATGLPLTTRDDAPDPVDVFHSRLAVSNDGGLLLSAGWVWHPWGVLDVYDLERALVEPQVLDRDGDVFGRRSPVRAEVAGACFVDRDVAVSTMSGDDEPDRHEDLGPNTLARWSTVERRFVWSHEHDVSPGDLVSVAGNILALNGHPRLYDATTGELVREWPDLPTGQSDSAITWSDTLRGPGRIAVDGLSSRFAYTDGTRVVVEDV